MSEQNADFTHEDEQGVRVVTFCNEELADLEQIIRIRKSLANLIDSGVQRLILDFQNVTYVSSQFMVVLIVLRKKLSAHKRFKQLSERNWECVQISPDRQTAMAAIANVDSDPLILCAVGPELRDFFRFC